MNTTEINNLYEVINAGESAQDQLNQYVGEIYDFYLSEIERQKAELKKEYPEFDSDISPLERLNGRFHKFNLRDNFLVLTGYDYFRGETDYESDELPRSIFGVDDWKKQVTEFVKSKIDPERVRIEKTRLRIEEEERKQFETLKQKYEGTK